MEDTKVLPFLDPECICKGTGMVTTIINHDPVETGPPELCLCVKLFMRLAHFAQVEDASFVVVRKDTEQPEIRWSASLVWGQEAPDSPMAGAASHGIGATAGEALLMIVEEIGGALTRVEEG